MLKREITPNPKYGSQSHCVCQKIGSMELLRSKTICMYYVVGEFDFENTLIQNK